MASLDDIHRRNHRQQLVMLLGATSLALLLGAAPRNARALFVFGGPQAPKAFAAVVAPPAGGGGAAGDGGFFARSFGPRGATDPGITAPAAPGGASGFGPIGGAFAPAAGRGGPFQLASFVPDAGGSQTSGPLAGSSAPAFAPAAPATNSAAASSPGTGTTGGGGAGGGTGGAGGGTGGGTGSTSGGTTTDPGGGTTTSPTDPVAPLPEPSAWLTMVLGFFGLGALVRRKRGAPSVQPQALSLETH